MMPIVAIRDTGERYRCPSDATVLAGMERLGRKGIPVGCRGGGCGVCKIEVLKGGYRKMKMSRAHVSEAEEADGVVLACRVMPETDLTVRITGAMSRNFLRHQPDAASANGNKESS